MKKILLGTTGLVAVALLATAASAETPKVTLGGFSTFQGAYTSDDKDAGQRKDGWRNDNTVTIKADGKTAGGLGYGAEIDLQADTTSDASNGGVNASRTFTYLDGKWGRVEMGDNKSVAATMRVDASTVAAGTGGINGDWTYFVNGQGDATHLTNTLAGSQGFITTSKLPGEHGSTTALGDESLYNTSKVSYYTPKFAGVQAGVSLTPALASASRGQTVVRTDTGAQEDVWDFGLGYEGNVSGVKLAAAGTYEVSSAKRNASSTPYTNRDINAWNLGALAGYHGFSLAGSYGDWSNSDRSGANAGQDSSYWTAGLGYAAGPVGVSATYLDSTRDVVGSSNDFRNLVLGAEYKLAAGLTPYAEVSFYDFDANGQTGAGAYNNTGTTVLVGTQVAF